MVCQKQTHLWNYKTNIIGRELFQQSFMKLEPGERTVKDEHWQAKNENH